MIPRAALAPLLLVLLLLAACGSAAPPASADTPASPTAPEPAARQPGETPAPTGQGGSPTAGGFTPTLIRLTEPGCCAQPFWSADGREVWFIAQPEPGTIASIYGVSVEGGPLRPVSQQVGLFSPDRRYMAYLDREFWTVIEDTLEGTSWRIPNRGRQVFFSPGNKRLAWSENVYIGAFNNRRTTVSISNLDGSAVRELLVIRGGSIVGWLDDEHLLLLGRDEANPAEQVLFSFAVAASTRIVLARSQRIRAVTIAPGGRWISYAVTFDPGGVENDGIWVVSADGRTRHRLPVVGSAQWRDASRLLVIPMEPGAPSHRLVQFDAATGTETALTDPAAFPFRVFAADWQAAPGGERIVFVSAADQALWVFDLPPAEEVP